MSSHSDQLDALAGALAAAQGEFVAIPKDSANPFFKSKYAGLPKVVEVASPILSKHGLSVSQFIGTDEHGETLTTWLLHKSGQFICESMRLHTSPAKGLSDVQGQGSATTYARRYSYMAVLGLVADDDDDGNRAARPVERAGKANGSNGHQHDAAPELGDAAVRIVSDAIKAGKPGTERLRQHLIAMGVEHVPDGQITQATIRRLTQQQALDLTKWCQGLEAKS